MLERLAIFATLLSGFGEGVAVVLAVKSLARYPELRATSSAAAERFIIGTFASTLFAAGSAGLAWWLISLW
jgi:F0F1-type ATP synthase membrane subunit c/vacuolar-type H+-ATPase subunit K